MSLFWLLFCLFVRTAALRPGRAATEPQAEDQAPLSAGPDALDRAESSNLERVVRGAKDGGFWKREPHPRRHDDPSGFFTTPRTTSHTSAPLMNSSSGGSGLLNPLFPVTDGSYWAYAVLLLALVLFTAGLVGNLALMCIVWHNVYLKSTWNCILAGLAFWDFLVLFFCLPVVIFHELTLKRLLGDLSCQLVPYLEVTSLGVATFSLCALSIDRFHAATGPAPHQTPKVEPCQSIMSKVGVIWVGSMVLAAPELLLWQLHKETISPPALQQNQPAASLMAALRTRSDPFKVDVCVCKPSEDLPEAVYALVLTYHEARVWWIFGCYLCLPLLFTLACDLVTQRVLSQRVPPEPISEKNRCSSSVKKHQNEQSLRAAVAALTVLYVSCNLPHSICNITLLYVSVPVLVLPVLALVEQFLLFVHCSAVPVLLLCLCRSLGRAFMDCCCCCCGECLSDTPPSLSSSCKEETIKIGSATEPGRTLQLSPERPAESRTTGTPC